jgi:hypothetical protein
MRKAIIVVTSKFQASFHYKKEIWNILKEQGEFRGEHIEHMMLIDETFTILEAVKNVAVPDLMEICMN